MTLVDRLIETEQRFLTWTNWKGYLAILEAFQGVHVKVTYDRGRLELLTTSPIHEEIKKCLAHLVEDALYERAIPYKSAGATTFRREILDRGLEPDDCFYLANLPRFTLGQAPETIPAPDLALEVEVSRSALDRLAIYQALGVREVWRYSADHRLRVEALGPNGYEELERSTLLPHLPLEELPRFVRMGVEVNLYHMRVAFKEWLAQL